MIKFGTFIISFLLLCCNVENLRADDFGIPSLPKENHFFDESSVQSNPGGKSSRLFYIGLGSGYPEIFSLRLGCQISRHLSVALKLSDYINRLGGIFNIGTPIIGVRSTYYFNETYVWFNNISLDVGFSKSGSQYNYVLDFSMGYESKSKRSPNLFFAFGFSALVHNYGKPMLIPGGKLGIIFIL